MFIPEWLIAVALTLFVLDIFVATDVLTWAAFGTLATYITWRVHPSPLWAVLVFISSFAIVVFAYYQWGGRTLVRRLMSATVLRGAPKDVNERIVGMKGPICWRNDQAFIRIEDELWPVDTAVSDSVAEGDQAQVKAFKNGAAKVSKVS